MNFGDVFNLSIFNRKWFTTVHSCREEKQMIEDNWRGTPPNKLYYSVVWGTTQLLWSLYGHPCLLPLFFTSVKTCLEPKHSISVCFLQYREFTYEHSWNESCSIHHCPDSWSKMSWCCLVSREKNMTYVSNWPWNIPVMGTSVKGPQNATVAGRSFHFLQVWQNLWVPEVLRTPDGKWQQEAAERGKEGICFFV